MWNVHQRVIEDLPRTNNSVEGWHRGSQQSVDCYHPSVFKLVMYFCKEQDKVEIEIALKKEFEDNSLKQNMYS